MFKFIAVLCLCFFAVALAAPAPAPKPQLAYATPLAYSAYSPYASPYVVGSYVSPYAAYDYTGLGYGAVAYPYALI